MSEPTPIRVGDSLAYRLHRTARLLRRHFLQLAQARGLSLTPEQWFILNKLRQRGARTQSELSEEIFSDKPNMTRMLATMQRQQMIERTRDPEDRRCWRVQLSDAGRTLHDTFAAGVGSVRTDVFQGISEQDQAVFLRVLGRLEQNILRGAGIEQMRQLHRSSPSR